MLGDLVSRSASLPANQRTSSFPIQHPAALNDHSNRPKATSAVASYLLLITMLLAGTIALPGCSGCRKSKTAAQKQAETEEELLKKNEKRKPDFEIYSLRTYPNDPDQAQNFVKPGHWVTLMQQVQANNFDFQANIELTATDKDGINYPIPNADFHIVSTRPASLPKGQVKATEMMMFVPPLVGSRANEKQSVYFENQLRDSRRGTLVSEGRESTSDIEDHTFFLVVLAKNPNSYRFLKILDSVVAPRLDDDRLRTTHYRVVLPKVNELVPLPSQSLTWTSIAYLIWDDLDPQTLTPAQQSALVDWLHWGGQLIINGPNSLEELQRGFLGDYLPAERLQARELTETDLQPLNSRYSIASTKQPIADRQLQLGTKGSLLGVQWKLHPDARELPDTGGLVCERAIGGGRIVVTALPLDDPKVTKNWKSFDHFFNSCLLRRPGRDFRGLNLELPGNRLVKWSNWSADFAEDPRINSTLRFFSRDVGRLADATAANHEEDYRFRGTKLATAGGVAAWDSESGTTMAVRDAMREAAGIRIPDAPFIFKMLATYLIILVPLNWIIFRLLGKVEWAWLMVPVIAVGGAIAVIRLAQLDIGFARSRREIAVLELQSGYPRGHLTRYTMLYSSLSTDYSVDFTDDSALAYPLSKLDGGSAPKSIAATRPLRVRRDETVHLDNLLVRSNSMEFLRSEQMVPLGGSLQLRGDADAGWELVNSGTLSLRDTAVIWRQPSGEYVTAWIGDLAEKSNYSLDFSPAKLSESGQPWMEEWEKIPAMSLTGAATEGEIRLAFIAQLAIQKMKLAKGDMRLVGWSDQELPGISFQPRASQESSRLLTICHLQRAAWPATENDVNVRTDHYAGQAQESAEQEEETQPAPGP